ncbi:MAG: hypothetical protein IJS14_13950 [Lentisphaeria bacterium]|nr:hypothetical protein [Lentisphaeria bacterium]
MSHAPMCETAEIKKLIEKAIEGELEGTWFFQWYSPEELSVIYNGIGPDRFPEWLRALLTSCAKLFEPAALIHDLEYFLGGTQADFTAANTRFHDNCKRLILREYPWWSPMRYILLSKARRWAGYCQQFGDKNYNFKTGMGNGSCESSKGK